MRPMSMVAYGLANMLCVMGWPGERWGVRRRRLGDGECLSVGCHIIGSQGIVSIGVIDTSEPVAK